MTLNNNVAHVAIVSNGSNNGKPNRTLRGGDHVLSSSISLPRAGALRKKLMLCLCRAALTGGVALIGGE